MFPRLERFLAVLAAAAILATAAFWAFPPELRFPDPQPQTGVSKALPVEAPIASAPAAPAPAPPPDDVSAPPVRNEPPAPAAAGNPEEAGQGPPAMISLALREKLPEASLSDEDIRVLTETILTFRESMQGLRETERTPENAERIREMMRRVEDDRRRFEATAGMSINEFLRRVTTDGIDNEKREEDHAAPEPLARPGR